MKTYSIKIFMLCIMMLGGLLVGCKAIDEPIEKIIVDETKDIEILNINEIIVDVSSIDINIISDEREDVSAHLYGETTSQYEHELSMNVYEGALKISLDVEKKMNIGFTRLDLDVYVPNYYKGSMEINSSSSDVDIKDFELSNLIVDVSSGDIMIEEIKSSNLLIDVSSGDTNISNIDIGKFQFDSSSGDLTGDNINTQSIFYNVSAGEIKLEQFKGDIEGENSSGDVEVGYQEFDNNINLRASSGSVVIDLPRDAEFYLNAIAGSGDISCEFPINIIGEIDEEKVEGTVISDKNKISIKTTSGDIDLY